MIAGGYYCYVLNFTPDSALQHTGGSFSLVNVDLKFAFGFCGLSSRKGVVPTVVPPLHNFALTGLRSKREMVYLGFSKSPSVIKRFLIWYI